MIDKIKALPHKTMMLIGIVVLLIDIIFYIGIRISYEIRSNRLLDFVYYFLAFLGMSFMAMAYKKKMKVNKS